MPRTAIHWRDALTRPPCAALDGLHMNAQVHDMRRYTRLEQAARKDNAPSPAGLRDGELAGCCRVNQWKTFARHAGEEQVAR